MFAIVASVDIVLLLAGFIKQQSGLSGVTDKECRRDRRHGKMREHNMHESNMYDDLVGI